MPLPRLLARTALLLAASAACAEAAPPQSAAPANAELAAAAALLHRNETAKAVSMLNRFTKAQPRNTLAQRMLGDARLRAGQTADALAAYSAILAVDAREPRALYGIGVVHAMRGEKDAALAWLAKARATHRLDMSMITTDARLKELREDPRFTALLPRPADFADPFVEKVEVIREWDGEAANGQFGWIARGVGDVDGDGIQDFVTSAPTLPIGGDSAGRVYVYSTGSGKLLWSVDGRPGDELGTGLESAGDTDGDGVQDVIASAPGAGAAYVYSGKDGHVLLTLHAENAKDRFGNHVASVGDIDHDGHADVIVGAPSNGANGANAGRAYVYSGKDGHVLLTLTGAHAGDEFGSAVSGYTGPRGSLIIAGAPRAGARGSGTVYVYASLSDKPKFSFESDATGGRLGYMFLSVPGDVDGDGSVDVFASDWSNWARGPSTGRVYVYSGSTGKALLTLTGTTAGEGFGTTKSVAGDVDGDGHADLIVGSWQYGGAAVSGGRAYLYSGADGRLIRTYTCRTPGDTFGFDAVALGDTDHDGTTDLLITSGWSAVKGFHSGRVFLLSSGVRHAAR